MTKILKPLLVVALLARIAFAVQPATHTEAQDVLLCQQYASSISGTVSAFTNQTAGAFGPFESAIYTFTFTEVEPGTGATVRLVADPSGAPTLAKPISVPGSMSFSMSGDPADQPPGLGYFFDSGNEGLVNISVSCAFAGCMPEIPEQAVVGAFTQNAEIYWEPGQLASSEPYVEAGSTYWVAGQDETGIYRKVLISCTWVWVRAETVGPNYDEVWNGAPLPTDVVE
jgi:hypothetical protein